MMLLAYGYGHHKIDLLSVVFCVVGLCYVLHHVVTERRFSGELHTGYRLEVEMGVRNNRYLLGANAQASAQQSSQNNHVDEI
jgi:hypothetical protein